MPSPHSHCQNPLFSVPRLETSHLPLLSTLPSTQSLFGETAPFSPYSLRAFRLRCHGHSLLLSSYLHRISRKENSVCSARGHFLQDLNHLLLDRPASEPLRKAIFGSSLSILDLWSRPWGVARLLGHIPRKGSGSTTTITNIIRIRAYDKELRLKLRSINMNCKIFF